MEDGRRAREKEEKKDGRKTRKRERLEKNKTKNKNKKLSLRDVGEVKKRVTKISTKSNERNHVLFPQANSSAPRARDPSRNGYVQFRSRRARARPWRWRFERRRRRRPPLQRTQSAQSRPRSGRTRFPRVHFPTFLRRQRRQPAQNRPYQQPRQQRTHLRVVDPGWLLLGARDTIRSGSKILMNHS